MQELLHIYKEEDSNSYLTVLGDTKQQCRHGTLAARRCSERQRRSASSNLDTSVAMSSASESTQHSEAVEEPELHAATGAAERDTAAADTELEDEVLGAIGAALGRGALSGAHA